MTPRGVALSQLRRVGRALVGLLVLVALPRTQSAVYSWTGSSYLSGDSLCLADLDSDGYADVVTALDGITAYGGRGGLLLWDIPPIALCAGAGGIPSRLSSGDVDRDGYSDVVYVVRAIGGSPAYVSAVSGRAGQVAWCVSGTGSAHYGVGLCASGDADGDGHSDALVSSPAEPGVSGANVGAVWVLSGKNGGALRVLSGVAADQWFGVDVAYVDDVDGDGGSDFAVLSGSGTVELFSGRTGGSLWVWTAGLFATKLRSGSDINGDGVADLMVIRETRGGYAAGDVSMLSGRSGVLLYAIASPVFGQQFGVDGHFVGDINHDGTPDLAVVVRDYCNTRQPNSVQFFSGVAGAFLQRVVGPKCTGWAAGFAAGKDVNGDGVVDFAVSELFPFGPASAQPLVTVLSSDQLALTGSSQTVVVGGAGQDLALDAGAQRAGGLYIMLGSISGQRPGLNIGSSSVPLNWDAYLVHTATYPNAVPIQNSLGVLDANGRGSARFFLPQGSPQGLSGLTFDHAFVVLGPGPLFVSNAVAATVR